MAVSTTARKLGVPGIFAVNSVRRQLTNEGKAWMLFQFDK